MVKTGPEDLQHFLHSETSELPLAGKRMTNFNPNTILFFEADQCAPSEKELEVLKRWLSDWRSQSKAKKLVIGGALDTPRSGRLRRFRSILNSLHALGVSSRAIQPAGDWFMPTRMGMTEALPADVAWIGSMPASTQTSKPKTQQIS